MWFVEGSTLEWLVHSQGVFLWPQTLLVVITLTLVGSAIDMTRRRVYMPRRFRHGLRRSAESGSCLEARDWLRSQTCPLAGAARAGLDTLQQGGTLDEAVEEVGQVAEDLSISMDRRLGLIATLANVSMMVGLLGTVCGLVASFSVIGERGEAPPPSELAAGVSQALSTTIVGLTTAIPALLVYAYLRSVGNRILFNLEREAVWSVKAIWRRERGNGSGEDSKIEEGAKA